MLSWGHSSRHGKAHCAAAPSRWSRQRTAQAVSFCEQAPTHPSTEPGASTTQPAQHGRSSCPQEAKQSEASSGERASTMRVHVRTSSPDGSAASDSSQPRSQAAPTRAARVPHVELQPLIHAAAASRRICTHASMHPKSTSSSTRGHTCWQYSRRLSSSTHVYTQPPGSAGCPTQSESGSSVTQPGRQSTIKGGHADDAATVAAAAAAAATTSVTGSVEAVVGPPAMHVPMQAAPAWLTLAGHAERQASKHARMPLVWQPLRQAVVQKGSRPVWPLSCTTKAKPSPLPNSHRWSSDSGLSSWLGCAALEQRREP